MSLEKREPELSGETAQATEQRRPSRRSRRHSFLVGLILAFVSSVVFAGAALGAATTQTFSNTAPITINDLEAARIGG